MVKAFIISALCFTIGNIIWDKWGMDEPRLFYIPLASFLLTGSLCVKKLVEKRSRYVNILVEWVILLALGNAVKQVFYYDYEIKQINDYVYGSAVSVWTIWRLFSNYLIQRKKSSTWETPKQHSGKKHGN